MKKADIEKLYAEKRGISQKEAEEQFDTFLDIIEDGLVQDGLVEITKRFRTEIVPTKARKGRHPQTGEEIDIPAGRKYKWTALKRLQSIIGK